MLIVSNRLPFTVYRDFGELRSKRSSGGLVAALDAVLRQQGGTWIGWPGHEIAEDETIPVPDLGYGVESVELSREEADRYYHGLSNGTLWPLCHSFPDRTRYRQEDWECYDLINRRFAEAAVAGLGTGTADPGFAWIHDYHLMRCPRYLRELQPGISIGFFFHIPFPPFDIFRMLPWARKILRGMLESDLIGFHVEGYAHNFIDCTERLLSLRVDREHGLIESGERTVQVGAFPLGIDYSSYEQLAQAQPAAANGGEAVVLGVDRLDYTKGIPERILTFEKLLELHPEHREKVVLLQLAVPSRAQVREYRGLKREIDELVGRVNGRFATSSWSPIRYLYRSVSPEELCTMYRDARVAMVTPLRDGMNLVAKEFVASQTGDPGVLVLSHLAGASETMHGALLANPLDLNRTAETLHRALTMEESERRSRMLGLQRRERKHTVDVWADRFLGAARIQPQLAPVDESDFERWLGRFVGEHQVVFLLDYDGTLVPICDHPDRAILDEKVRELLHHCAARDDTDLGIVSGRALDDVRRLVGLEGLTYAGNHGLEIEAADMEPFLHQDLSHYAERLASVADSLEEIHADGAWVERKGASLTFHYRNAPIGMHTDLAERAGEIIRGLGFQPHPARCAVEARPPIGWDKGHAVLHILRQRYGPGWSESVRPIYVGDDRTDEDAFRVLSGLGITFRVGAPHDGSQASRSLPNVDAVHALVRWIANR